jgi:hypothetical protein
MTLANRLAASLDHLKRQETVNGKFAGATQAAADGAGWEDLREKFGLTEHQARIIVFGKKPR